MSLNLSKTLLFIKQKGSFIPLHNDFGKSSRSTHDPRSYAYRKERTLSDFDMGKLKRITNGNCAVLLYTPLSNGINEMVNLCCDNDINAEQLNECVEVKSIPHITNEILKNKPGLSLTEFQEALKQEMKVNEQSANRVAFKTKSQSSSSTWFALRLGRMTASKVKQCMKNVNDDGIVSRKNNSILGNILAYSPPIQTREMKHGIKIYLDGTPRYLTNRL